MLDYTILQVENVQKQIAAIIVVPHKKDENRRTVKYFKFNRWFASQTKYVVALSTYLPEFAEKLNSMGYDLLSTNPNSNY